MNTIEYLDLLKARFNWGSDYRLCKEIGISQSRMSNYRMGKSSMDDDLALQVENLLDLPPGTVLLDMHAERTKCPDAARVLRKLARQTGSAAASLFLTLSMIYSMAMPEQAAACPADQVCSNIYYVKSLLVWITHTANSKTLFFGLFLINQLIIRYLCYILGNAKKRHL